MYINKNVAISETGFVFNPLSGDSFSTNKIGQEILHKLKDSVSLQDLTDHICATFNVDEHIAEKDIADFLMSLKSYQILFDDEA